MLLSSHEIDMWDMGLVKQHEVNLESQVSPSPSWGSKVKLVISANNQQ